jgi:tetratricopeptide (TPR) repeat protein
MLAAKPVNPKEDSSAPVRAGSSDSSAALLQLQLDLENGQMADGIVRLRSFAKALVQKQRYEEAVPVFEALLAADPSGVQTQESLARCLDRLGRWAEAIARYQLVLDADPERPDTLAALGLCLVRQDTPLAALSAFARCLRLNPSHMSALLGKATCLRLTGDQSGAEAIYREAIRVQPEIESSLNALMDTPAEAPASIQHTMASEISELENIIAAAVSAQDYLTAALHCRTLTEVAPDYYEAWFNLGVFEQCNSNLESAAEAFLGAARQMPLSVEPLQALAQAYHLAGDLKAAESSYRSALSIAPDSPDLSWNLGLVLEQREDLAGAANQYSRLVKCDQDRGEAWFRLGYVRLHLNDQEGAVVAFRRARDLGARTFESNFNLGVAYWGLGRVRQAAECFRAALTMQPNFTPAHRALAAAALSEAEYSRARELLRDLLERGDASVEILFNLAVLEHRANRVHSAIEFYKQALKIDPDLSDASAGLALAQNTLSARRYN